MADGGDGPGVAVAYRLPVVVVSRRSLRRVATTSPTRGGFTGCDPCRTVGIEVAGGAPGGLDGLVDGVDVVVRRGDDGDAAASVVVVDPGRGETVEVGVERAGDDAAVRFVGVERPRIAGSEP